MQKDIYNIRLLQKEMLAEKTWIFTFEKPFNFTAGQYVTMLVDTESRDFTIASSPWENTFSIVTKSGISLFKKKLFSLALDSFILVKHPAGGFTITDKSTHYVFLAGGIGITPFYSMISDIHKKGLRIPLTLLASFSQKRDIIFYKELKKIEKENAYLKSVFTLSDDTWNGEVGRISKNLISKHIQEFKSKKYLIAGSEKMVEDSQQILVDMGVDESHIRIDIFTGY